MPPNFPPPLCGAGAPPFCTAAVTVLIGLGWVLQILSTPKSETLEEELAEIQIDETPIEKVEEEPVEA